MYIYFVDNSYSAIVSGNKSSIQPILGGLIWTNF